MCSKHSLPNPSYPLIAFGATSISECIIFIKIVTGSPHNSKLTVEWEWPKTSQEPFSPSVSRKKRSSLYLPALIGGLVGGVWPDYWGDVGSLDEIVLNTTSHIQALLPTRTSLNSGWQLKVNKSKNCYFLHSSPLPCRRTGSRGGP